MHHHSPPIEDIEEFKSVEELANSTKVSERLWKEEVFPAARDWIVFKCHIRNLSDASDAIKRCGKTPPLCVITAFSLHIEHLSDCNHCITAIRDFAQFRPRGTWSSRARVILKDGSAKGSVCIRSSRRNPRWDHRQSLYLRDHRDLAESSPGKRKTVTMCLGL